ncbi:ubiquinol-cytochrome C chaperone family protein [Luteithermobacter gelatinilyticus]|uniref:ubiquinol-cytochrome C chaperone family protein n=1 Tax=Luteithermobacter gelatinilyticus TaxID=2582913 RepID=UPI0011065421|nr:ubiquinol-cytochrome C chaperone family protein [Luteithermobacter gelatinilyticus]
MFDFLRRRSKLKNAAYQLFDAVVEQSRQPYFYTRLKVADTLDGRFDLICLHMILLLRRLAVENGKNSALLQRYLQEVMFENLDLSLREMGVGDLSVGKKIKAMAEAFYGRRQAYEENFHDRTALKLALLRNMYRGQEPESEKLEALVEYILTLDAHLENQTLSNMYQGQVNFDGLIEG